MGRRGQSIVEQSIATPPPPSCAWRHIFVPLRRSKVATLPWYIAPHKIAALLVPHQLSVSIAIFPGWLLPTQELPDTGSLLLHLLLLRDPASTEQKSLTANLALCLFEAYLAGADRVQRKAQGATGLATRTTTTLHSTHKQGPSIGSELLQIRRMRFESVISVSNSVSASSFYLVLELTT